MRADPNRDSFTATPTNLSSPFITPRWASNTYDTLTIFAFPSDNQIQYAFTTANQRSKISFNQILHCKTRDRKTSFRLEEVLQFYINVKDALVWAKCTTEEVKVQLIHQNLIKCPIAQDYSWRFYSSYSVNREINNLSFKLGALWSNPPSNNFLDTRIRWNKSQFNNEQYLYCKGGYTFNEVWNFGGIFAMDLKRRVLQKNDIKFGWEINDSNWVSLQLQTEGFRNYKKNYLSLGSYFDILRGNYICHFDDIRLIGGLSAQYNLENKQLKKFVALIEYSNPGKVFSNLKAKISSLLQLAVGVTYSHSASLKGEIGLTFNKLSSLKPGLGSYGVNLTIGDQ